MPASSFLALLDDVVAAAKVAAASTDDIAVLTAKNTKKASGIVVDDMAVTAGGMVGVDPSRELPIVWAVAKRSLINKLLILIPGALLLNYFIPWAITPLLMMGGAYLCFEAVEKVLHRDPHDQEPDVVPANVDLVQLEKEKIQHAARTDMILSAEIVALTLAGVVEEGQTFGFQAMVLVMVGIIVTFGVYGIVGLLVKLDDIGVHLSRAAGGARQAVGRAIIRGAPGLFKLISIVGTVAMLLVGGEIILHGLHIEHYLEGVHKKVDGVPLVGGLIDLLAAAVTGVIAGLLTIPVAKLLGFLWGRLRPAPAT